MVGWSNGEVDDVSLYELVKVNCELYNELYAADCDMHYLFALVEI